MTTLRTLSEIRATCTKAARGAGCPWGMAEEAGMAVWALEAHGAPGVAALAELLSGPRACSCDGAAGAPACGLAAMTALSDTPPPGRTELGPVAAPLLLAAPFLLGAEDGVGWRIDWGTGGAHVGPGGVSFDGAAAPARAEAVSIAPAPAPHPRQSADRCSRSVPNSAWARLEALAARTYVPETHASRASGAGPTGGDRD